MPADERLALIRLKIERADKHIGDLQEAVRSFLDSNPYKVDTKRNPETRKLIYYVASVKPVPVCIATITGDILHCLRDALDHLAQQLYLVGTGNAKGFRDQTGFPISSSAKDFKTGLLRKVEGMRQDAIEAIRAIEPYAGGQGADLWTFHRLNNIDKHRLVVTVGSSFRSVDIGPHMARIVKDIFPAEFAMPSLFIRPADNLFPLEAGKELFIDAVDAEPNEKMQFRFDVAVNEPGVIEGKPILETLVQLSDRINGVVESFRSCLE
jgi:hypothetical protein